MNEPQKYSTVVSNEISMHVQSTSHNLLILHFDYNLLIFPHDTNYNLLIFPHVTDYNECRYENGRCEQQCENTYGSYKCRCEDGYTMNLDGHSCDGEFL